MANGFRAQTDRKHVNATAVLSIVTTQKLELLSRPIDEIQQCDIPTLTKITLTKHKENKGCCWHNLVNAAYLQISKMAMNVGNKSYHSLHKYESLTDFYMIFETESDIEYIFDFLGSANCLFTRTLRVLKLREYGFVIWMNCRHMKTLLIRLLPMFPNLHTLIFDDSANEVTIADYLWQNKHCTISTSLRNI